MREFRFSTNIFGISTRAEFGERCRRIEQLGYHAIYAADHLGIPAPFPLLVAAAEATERLRLGTLVLDAPFWNAALLAREVATTDILTDGRLELGLGAGHMKWEFDTAGITWEPFGARVARLAELIVGLEGFFTSDLDQLPPGVREPKPVQRVGFGGSGPPLLIGGTGDRVLRLAARYADVVGIAGVFQIAGKPPGTFRLGTSAEAGQRVEFVRELAGGRVNDLQWQLLVQAVIPTDDRRATAQQLLDQYGPTMSVEQLLDSPFILLGTPAQMAEQLLATRERYGFSHITVHQPYFEQFAPVIALLHRESALSAQ